VAGPVAAAGPEPVDVPRFTIATPDRRLRVFVSSTLEELAAERVAVRAAITGLRLTPVMFELGSRTHPPRELYRAYLDQSDVFVGIYGERYGWTAPDMAISGLEDEYELSAHKPRLLYVRRTAPGREPRLQQLITRMQAVSGSSTTPYDSPDELAERVADDLAVLMTERFTAADVPALPGLAPGWLPTPATPMVDRQRELALVLGLLRDPAVRLVTLSGPGGIGKTRLALAAAQELVAERDAVWLVDLQSVRDPADVAGAVAAAVGVAAEGRGPVLDLVADRLAGNHVLIVVDNLEQVLDAAPELGRLLARCPATQLLVTSRRVLRLRGEHGVPLGPLGLPQDGGGGPAAAAVAPAVQLFLDRARQADPAFTVDDASAGAVAAVVRRLDGVPLAIELVAARVRILPPVALLRRLDSGLEVRGPGMDVPDRQRTLRSTVAWSHDLLDEQERALLARLSVSSSGATIDMAEAVSGSDLDVPEVLSSLVGHSLVTPTDTCEGEPRFRMLTVVRSFAAERLRERGEEETVRERWAGHLAGVSEAAGIGLSGPDRHLWEARLETETADLQEAVRWAVATDRAELAVALTAPLARWWWARGLLVPMAAVADETARLPSAAALPERSAALLQWARGTMRIALGRAEEAQPLLAGVVDGARERDDPWLLGHGLVGLAMTRLPDDPALPGLFREAVEALRRSGDVWSVAFALVPYGDLALVAGDVPGAMAAHEEALGLARGIGDDHLVATLLDQLALDALLSGDAAAGRGRLREAAGLHRSLGDLEGLANCLDGLAGLALVQSDPRTAARLSGTADAVRTRLGVAVWPLLQSLVAGLADGIRAALGDDEDLRERAAGAGLDPWDALDAGLAAVAGPAG
jgi:predicted ATPase